MVPEDQVAKRVENDSTIKGMNWVSYQSTIKEDDV